MWVHPRRDPPDVLLPEPDAKASPDDHRLGIEQVDGRGDPRAERLHRAVDQVRGEIVAVLQCALPDSARQPITAALLHDLEEVGLGSLLDPLAGLDLHRAPSRIGLHAALPPAGASGPAALDTM